MFRYVLYFLLVSAVLVHIISISIHSANDITTCYDEMDANDFSQEYNYVFTQYHTKKLCETEYTAIKIYDLCYRQVQTANQKASVFGTVASMLAEFFRPDLKVPYAYVASHNAACASFSELQIKDIKPLL